MNALVYEDFDAPLTLQTVSRPAPTPRGVVLKVLACGVCRSDWHGWKGHDPMITPPNVPGHEVVGTVTAVGDRVEEWAEGERVTVPFVGGCGTCEQCRAGQHQVCPNQFQPGFSAQGAFAEFVRIDYADENLVRLPTSIDAVTGASLGCRFATAFRAVIDQGEARSGDWVAVHGCGGVGLSAVMIARAAGAQVVAVDIADAALSLADEVGASRTINADDTDDVAAAVRNATQGGVHLSLDALGSPDTCRNSVANLRKRGRHVQVGLLVGENVHTAIPFDRVVADELELRGAHGLQAHRYPALFSMIEAGRLRPRQLVRQTIPLAEAADHLQQMGNFAGTGIAVIDDFG
ncbi:zinc-dependent alcohol dehydrogenase family protein [Salinibacter grassmerensis]|uniref:zinc-dependent alcohol dehydrogenase family protein n=1 Tax=Salinibacter grassmerensis TaxID=3040353 RepID=UPI0021E7AA25|nr:zinc-dependent alcohol dehydrogenase family protein [Salinibacter grassmerensis]